MIERVCNMKIIRIDKNNQVNGDGLRCVVWVSGCENHCPGCHNPETWDYNCGHQITAQESELLFNQLSSPEISGLTFTGGDPLAPRNREDAAKWFAAIKRVFPQKTIWVYTGHLFEEVKQYLTDVDVLIDGKYVAALNPGIGKVLWRGSTNQRIIDVQQSLKQDKIIIYEN